MKTRIERDSMGELEVAENALYSAQTQRAINNFLLVVKVCQLHLYEAFY